MKKLVAVDGFTYEISDENVSATVELKGEPSITCMAGAGICKHGFSVEVTNISTSEAPKPDPGPYNVSFSATAKKCKADGSFVLRVDDKTGDINAKPKNPGPPEVEIPVTFHIKITDAGQSMVSGE